MSFVDGAEHMFASFLESCVAALAVLSAKSGLASQSLLEFAHTHVQHNRYAHPHMVTDVHST